jgi:hypothetical protein
LVIEISDVARSRLTTQPEHEPTSDLRPRRDSTDDAAADHGVPPWYSNLLSRLIKTPKLHLGDTGVACTVLGQTPDTLREDRATLGNLLETCVVQELRRQASWSADRVRFHHFRNKDGAEVDVVLEGAGRKIAGVEVKLSGTVVAKDFRGLKKLREAVDDRLTTGVVQYDGEDTVPFGDGLAAVPLNQSPGTRKTGGPRQARRACLFDARKLRVSMGKLQGRNISCTGWVSPSSRTASTPSKHLLQEQQLRAAHRRS